MMSSIRRSFSQRTAVRSAVLIVTALVFAACDDDDIVDPDPPISWEAALTGTGNFEDVTGAAEVISNSTAFAAEIAIDDAPADAVFAWAVMEGTCAAPGDRVGAADAYPDLEVNDDGAATAEADDSVALVEDDDYIVVVTDESGDDPVTVACAALELQD